MISQALSANCAMLESARRSVFTCNVASVVTAPTSDWEGEYAAKVVSVIGVTSSRRRSRPFTAEWMQWLRLWALAGAYGIRKPPSLALIEFSLNNDTLL